MVNLKRLYSTSLTALISLFLTAPQLVNADEIEFLISQRNNKNSDIEIKKDNEKNSLSKNNTSEINDLISSAMGLLGIAYRYGGTSAQTGFDCSGFMQYIFKKSMKIALPRTSIEQSRMGTQISKGDLQPGDLVFFNTIGRNISHVGLYIGNNRFIHAPRTGKTIEITSLDNSYWGKKYVTARRVKNNNPRALLP